jgi:hypothetical protein
VVRKATIASSGKVIMTQQINWNYVPDSVVAEDEASTEERIFFKEIEKVTQAHTNSTESPEKWGPGFMTTYWCDVFNEDEELIGTSIGTMIILYRRPSDGHLIEYCSEQIQLKDGAFAAAGFIDREDVLSQRWISYPVVGTGGRYKGMTGNRRYRINKLADQYPLIAEIELHRDK